MWMSKYENHWTKYKHLNRQNKMALMRNKNRATDTFQNKYINHLLEWIQLITWSCHGLKTCVPFFSLTQPHLYHLMWAFCFFFLLSKKNMIMKIDKQSTLFGLLSGDFILHSTKSTCLLYVFFALSVSI